MEGDFIKIHHSLLPLSYIYGLGVVIRNKLFDWNILQSRSFSVPVINIGNITVGGTGKTPHTEYLIRLLQEHFQVAVLSRGYKRKSKGYVLASMDTPVRQIGDEPFQMKHKYPSCYVAVDCKRPHGIDRLCNDKETADTEVVLLDDAYQHRYVTPGINILLVDYHRLICYDRLLPAGRLREPENGKHRANIVIITKCPSDIKPMDYRVITKAMNLYPYQKLFFSTLVYGNPQYLHDQEEKVPTLEELKEYDILLVSGIASPEQILTDLKPKVHSIQALTYGDHHTFTSNDMEHIQTTFNTLKSEKKLILITEKDASKMREVCPKEHELSAHIYQLPVKVDFLLKQKELFNQYIIDYVRKNSRNSILAQSQNDHKS